MAAADHRYRERARESAIGSGATLPSPPRPTRGKPRRSRRSRPSRPPPPSSPPRPAGASAAQLRKCPSPVLGGVDKAAACLP
jgi:hypothetical protein